MIVRTFDDLGDLNKFLGDIPENRIFKIYSNGPHYFMVAVRTEIINDKNL